MWTEFDEHVFSIRQTLREKLLITFTQRQRYFTIVQDRRCIDLLGTGRTLDLRFATANVPRSMSDQTRRTGPQLTARHRFHGIGRVMVTADRTFNEIAVGWTTFLLEMRSGHIPRRRRRRRTGLGRSPRSCFPTYSRLWTLFIAVSRGKNAITE